MTRIGWYVHHHGRGHLARLLAIAPHVAGDIVCFSSLAAPANLPANCSWMKLERDDADEPHTGGPVHERDVDAGGLLHWAPLLHNGHRRRLTTIATALDTEPVNAFVVDVSAEVALFVRLLGVPTVLITQPGARDDEPHRLAFAAATTVIAPWPGDLLQPEHLKGLRSVVYVGGISRFDGRDAEDAAGSSSPGGVLVFAGAGGSDVTSASLHAAAAATPELAWTALGLPGPDGGAGTWSDDPWRDLTSAEIVVAFAGQNSIADLAAAGVRAIVIPQERPFEEQVQTGLALASANLAVVAPSWPAAEEWPELLDRARELTPRWSLWRTAGAAQRAAAAIDAVADAGGHS